MKKYQFHGEIIKKEDLIVCGVPMIGLMRLYVEGQKEPIHRMAFSNIEHGQPTQVLDFTFQDYIKMSWGEFSEIEKKEIRDALQIYYNENEEKRA